MSHFTVLVIGEDPEEQLKKFDENLEMDQYVKATKEQLIQESKDEIEAYKNGTYAEYLADTEAYTKAHGKNEGHIKYVAEEFPKKLTWTDEEHYQNAIRYCEPGDIGPNGEEYSTRNPQSKWDWYQLGGRWQGFFKRKDGSKTVVGQPGVFGARREDLSDRCDQGLKKDIDFEGMYNEAADKASQRWAEIAALFGGSIPVVIRSWDDICNDASLNTKDLRLATYNAQDAIVAYKLMQEKYPRDSEECKALTEMQQDFLHGFHWGATMDEFACSREEYVGRAMVNAVSTFAIVKDGEWYEKGKMGWWAIVTDEQDEKEWNAQVQKLITEASDDTLFSLYDCHI